MRRRRRLPTTPPATTRTRRRLTIALEKVETLRYGENPHQPAARYRRPGSDARRRPVRDRRAAAPGQGAVLQQRARRGRGGRRSGGRCAARRASSSSTRTRAAPPSGRRSSRRGQAALAGDPVSAFGGVVALTRPVDARASPSALVVDLPRGRRRARFDDGRAARSWRPSRTCALVVDPDARRRRAVRRRSADPTARSAPPAAPCSSTAPDTAPDDPADLDGRDPTRPDRRRAARPRPRLAPGPRRDLERDRARPRPPAGRDGSGQTSRVDAARGAVDKAHAYAGADATSRARRARRTRSSRSPTRSRSASRPA